MSHASGPCPIWPCSLLALPLLMCLPLWALSLSLEAGARVGGKGQSRARVVLVTGPSAAGRPGPPRSARLVPRPPPGPFLDETEPRLVISCGLRRRTWTLTEAWSVINGGKQRALAAWLHRRSDACRAGIVAADSLSLRQASRSWTSVLHQSRRTAASSRTAHGEQPRPVLRCPRSSSARIIGAHRLERAQVF